MTMARGEHPLGTGSMGWVIALSLWARLSPVADVGSECSMGCAFSRDPILGSVIGSSFFSRMKFFALLIDAGFVEARLVDRLQPMGVPALCAEDSPCA